MATSLEALPTDENVARSIMKRQKLFRDKIAMYWKRSHQSLKTRRIKSLITASGQWSGHCHIYFNLSSNYCKTIQQIAYLLFSTDLMKRKCMELEASHEI